MTTSASSSALVVQNDRYIAFCEMFRAMFSDIDMALLIINTCDTGPHDFRSICAIIALTCGAAHMDAILRIYLSSSRDNLIMHTYREVIMDDYPIYKPLGLFELHSFIKGGGSVLDKDRPVRLSINIMTDKMLIDAAESDSVIAPQDYKFITHALQSNNTIYVNMQLFIECISTLICRITEFNVNNGNFITVDNRSCHISVNKNPGIFSQFNDIFKMVVIGGVKYFIISSAIPALLRREYIARLNEYTRNVYASWFMISLEPNTLCLADVNEYGDKNRCFSRNILYFNEQTRILQLCNVNINIISYELPMFYINNMTYIEELQMTI
jgi:hypothetical protein